MFNASSSSHGFSCNIMEPFSHSMYWQETAILLRSGEVQIEMEERRVLVIHEGRSYGHYPESCLHQKALAREKQRLLTPYSQTPNFGTRKRIPLLSPIALDVLADSSAHHHWP